SQIPIIFVSFNHMGKFITPIYFFVFNAKFSYYFYFIFSSVLQCAFYLMVGKHNVIFLYNGIYRYRTIFDGFFQRFNMLVNIIEIDRLPIYGLDIVSRKKIRNKAHVCGRIFKNMSKYVSYDLFAHAMIFMLNIKLDVLNT